jgi:hypothetical protein
MRESLSIVGKIVFLLLFCIMGRILCINSINKYSALFTLQNMSPVLHDLSLARSSLLFCINSFFKELFPLYSYSVYVNAER